MEHVNNTPLETDMPKVTGRKAARSLRLFRGDGYAVDPLLDIDSQEETSHNILTDAAAAAAGRDALSLTVAKTTNTSMYLLPGGTSSNTDKLPNMSSSGNEESERNDPIQRPLLEPVSSATYFPHTPVKDVQELAKTVDDSPDTGTLQHLMADLEFDHGSHGDITQIKMHKHDEDKSSNDNDRVTLHPEADAGLDSVANEAYPLTVELRPFKNKVGGHTAIFRFSKKAVCKALMNRENLWYEAVERKHLDLLKFMPKYIGVLNVRYSSLVSEVTMSPDLHPASDMFDQSKLAHDRRSSLSACEKSHRRVRVADDGLPPEVSLDDNRHIIPDLLWKQYSNSAPNASGFDELSGSSPQVASDGNTEGAEYEEFSIGSTSLNTDLQAQVIQEVFVPQARRSDDIFQMDDEDVARESVSEGTIETDRVNQELNVNSPEISPILRKHTRFERYILLEDLTANMQKPCALDLKMGTRQYGVEANESKQASQRKKCKLTTSRELGVRVCGLQVWHETKQRYYMRDKYFGRRLRSGMPFAKILAKFLYDGTSAFSVLVKIPSILKQLEELYRAFEKLNGYRMYGSSVLLMYDGACSSQVTDVSVHIIDFAQSVIGKDATNSHYSRPPKYPELPDMGYLRGLRSLMHYFRDIFEIFTGDRYDLVGEPTKYLEENKERLNKACYWIGAYAEDDQDVAGIEHEGHDPFDIHYVTNDDETGISD